MIKKYILGFGITLLSLISFSNAGLIPNQLIKVSSEIDSNYKISFLNKGQIISEYLGTSKPIIALSNNVLFWWGSNGLPYLYSPIGQGFFNTFYSCDELTENSTGPTNCSSQSLNSSSFEILKNFFNKVNIGDYSYYQYDNTYVSASCTRYRYYYNICFSSHEIGNSICFPFNGGCVNGCQGGATFCNGMLKGGLVNSQNLPSNTSFGSISSNWIGQAPGILNNSFDGGTGSFNNSGNIQLISDDVNSIINFFESRYGFSENICYVGTDDLDTEYGSGNLSFELGTGGTIFSLYRKFYSGTDLKDIGTFINVRQLNYNQWFNVRSTDENSFFLASWDGPGTNVKVLYNDLEFPFMGKPAALYFMSNYIFNSSPEFQMGDEIATYCFAKLNKDNLSNGSVDFTEYWGAVPDYVKGIVNTYSNYTIGSSVGFSKPDTDGGENNMRNIILNTGNSIPDDLSPTTLFVGFYNRITSLVQNYNPRFDPLLPLWIIYPMIFLILFRMLRH